MRIFVSSVDDLVTRPLRVRHELVKSWRDLQQSVKKKGLSVFDVMHTLEDSVHAEAQTSCIMCRFIRTLGKWQRTFVWAKLISDAIHHHTHKQSINKPLQTYFVLGIKSARKIARKIASHPNNDYLLTKQIQFLRMEICAQSPKHRDWVNWG